MCRTQESYWSWFSGVTDNALYPGIIVNMIRPLLNLTTANGTALIPEPSGDDGSVFEAGLATGGGWINFGFKVAVTLIMVVRACVFV